MEVLEYKQTEKYDLFIDKKGDFLTHEATRQGETMLLITAKGEWREAHNMGVGINSYIHSNDSGGVIREVRDQLSKDGFEIQRVAFGNKGNLEIEAKFKEK